MWAEHVYAISGISNLHVILKRWCIAVILTLSFFLTWTAKHEEIQF